MHKLSIVLAAIGILFLMAGCTDVQSIEDRAIVQISGYDYKDEENIVGTVAIPQYGMEESRNLEELTLSVEAGSLNEFDSKIERESSKPLSMGKLTVTLFNKELTAKNTMKDFMDVLSRDPRIGRNIYLAIAEDSAKEMIEGKYSQNVTTARYIKGLIENNAKRNFPETNLHHYLYAYYGEGLDGFLPVLSRENGHILYSGIAVLKKGKLVQIIPESEALTFKILREKVREGRENIEYKNGKVGIQVTNSDVKYKLEGSSADPQFTVNVNMDAFINEMKKLDIDSNKTPKLVHDVEKKFEEHFEEKMNKLILEFKENRTDPLGLGSIYQNRTRKANMEKWNENYASVPVKVNVNIELTGTGISY
ncbi:Ger(x)C family spore germination protein [Halobacillus sp. Marseille-Q1614]|uniref:Ger(x)C family spore germination protein n=1 Tax=Halobacillus sp. Marseille-Q1614 TaxID=2709134 RepID=UPI00157004CF|nr:Ger(x)C family spore germination protein [Halobacillus sp. Marseille-Q1614]